MEYLGNIIWHMGYNIVWHGGIVCHVSMDEWYLWMKMWMNFFMNVGNIFFLCKTKQKKKDGNFLCWFIFKNSTNEMLKSYFKSSLY